MDGHSVLAQPDVDVDALAARVYAEGIVGLPGLLGVERGRLLAEDFRALFGEVLSYPGGTVGRGPNRHYFSTVAERIRVFPDIVANPVFVALSERVLGPDWEVVEVAFDVPRPGAVHQPWHRDFPTPARTAAEGVLTSLAFNVTTVDVSPEMGPFEIAPGTQFDDGTTWQSGMFPPVSAYARYEQRRQPRLAKLGDVSARTGLAIHRGTPNRSATDRGVLVLGVVAPEDPTPEHHRLTMTSAYHARLPEGVRAHLRCRLVDQLPRRPEQEHDIEGLVMGAEPPA